MKLRLAAVLLAVTYSSKVVAESSTSTVPLTNDAYVFVATVPPPPIYTKLQWNYSTSSAIGYWYTKDQVVKINAEVEYLTDKAAKSCIDAVIKADKDFISSAPGLVLIIGASIVVGLVSGYEVARRL